MSGPNVYMKCGSDGRAMAAERRVVVDALGTETILWQQDELAVRLIDGYTAITVHAEHRNGRGVEVVVAKPLDHGTLQLFIPPQIVANPSLPITLRRGLTGRALRTFRREVCAPRAPVPAMSMVLAGGAVGGPSCAALVAPLTDPSFGPVPIDLTQSDLAAAGQCLWQIGTQRYLGLGRDCRKAAIAAGQIGSLQAQGYDVQCTWLQEAYRLRETTDAAPAECRYARSDRADGVAFTMSNRLACDLAEMAAQERRGLVARVRKRLQAHRKYIRTHFTVVE